MNGSCQEKIHKYDLMKDSYHQKSYKETFSNFVPATGDFTALNIL